MKNNHPIAVIGGYDSISKSFYSKIKLINSESIFINVNGKKIIGKGVYNYEVFQLKKILNVLHKYKVKNLLFLGKINRPDLSNLRFDGEIEKHIPILAKSFKKGDGNVLSSVLDIFVQKGFKIIKPHHVSESFFLGRNEFKNKLSITDKSDFKKGVKLLNDLSKYDNAQSVVCINGYIIAIEAVEGTDNLLKRVISLRKKLNQLDKKRGLLIKLPKMKQSRLVDLPVVGPKTLKLIKKANLNGIAINSKETIVYNKKAFLKFAYYNSLQIYNVLK